MLVVHLELTPQLARQLRAVAADPDVFEETLNSSLQQPRLSGVNLKRFVRHGLVTAELPDGSLQALRDCPGVQWVEVDGVQKAV
jgi:hypothetical protein